VACIERLAVCNAGLASLSAAATHARALPDRDAGALETAAAGYRHPWSAASAHEDAARSAPSAPSAR
jgi:hypothetical protein